MSFLPVGTGSCLCGAVSFTSSSMSKVVGACHCSLCRIWGGGPFMEVECGPDVVFEGREHIAIFQSSAWAERAFCNRCGTHLYMKIKTLNKLGLPEGYGIPAGLIDKQEALSFDLQVFIDQKPAYYCFSNATRTLTSSEIYEKYPQTRDMEK